MKETKLVLAAVLAMSSLSAFAQTAAPASDWTITGNAGLHSDYRFRGISQTNKDPAFQGGFDIAHSSGFYAGNWNSNIDSGFFAGSNLEMDFYTGFKGSAAGLGYDIGVLTYYYPGSSPKIDNTEIYLGVSYGPVTAKYFYAVTDFFGFDDSDGSSYLDLGFAYDLGSGFGVNAHIGYQTLEGAAEVTEIGGSGPHDSVTDYKIGLTYTTGNGFVLGLAYISTNRDLSGSVAGRNISDGTAVFSLSKSF